MLCCLCTGKQRIHRLRILNYIISLQIVQRYDILLIQEIRDISETAIETLIEAVNTDIG